MTDDPRHPTGKSWDDASPMEILDARVQSLEEGLNELQWIVVEALRYSTSTAAAAEHIAEEWGK